jgi:hypothetical protein
MVKAFYYQFYINYLQMGSGSISLKKKHVSSMVQKWQKVKKEVELEEQTRQIREAEIRRKLAELE